MTAVNSALDGAPELVNTAPYTDGWMYELRPSDAEGVSGLLDVATYREGLG